jgi:uncharacterized protein (DUF1684 family)
MPKRTKKLLVYLDQNFISDMAKGPIKERFLGAGLPRDGEVVLDFNKAYNPPCAFTPYATCPLPPQENRLAVAIAAGEKTYGH